VVKVTTEVEIVRVRMRAETAVGVTAAEEVRERKVRCANMGAV
jgi:hypothetical protein